MGCFGSSDPNAQLIKEVCRGKTEEQKKVIEYFCKQEGCLSKNMSDDEYMQRVFRKRDSMDFKKMAMKKCSLDEDEVCEIAPVMLQGFVFKNAYAKRRSNGNWVSSAYQVSWIFFTSDQLSIYRYTFNMDEDKKSESTDQFYYKDVTALSTVGETEEAHDLKGNKFEVESNMFKMVVPGERIFVSMNGVTDADSTIQAMKQKLKEKKL